MENSTYTKRAIIPTKIDHIKKLISVETEFEMTYWRIEDGKFSEATF